MASMVSHIVRYSNNADPEHHEQLFPTQKDAVEFAETILKSYRYVWLLEWGKYRNISRKQFSGYIYYWWSPAVAKTDWGECPNAGWGRPKGRRHLVEYQRMVYKTERWAHLNVRASATAEPAP
jgi:hypothetical protein